MAKKPTVPRHRGLMAQPHRDSAPGVLISVSGPDGSQAFSYQVSLGELPPPERRFVAHVAHAERRPYEIELSFGQRAPSQDSDPVYITLFIELAPEQMKMFLEHSRQPLQHLQQYLTEKHLEPVETVAFRKHPEQAVCLRANVIGFAFWGYEAILDFHYLSPWEYQRLGKGQVPTLEQVVRVQMPSPICASLLTRLEQLQEVHP